MSRHELPQINDLVAKLLLFLNVFICIITKIIAVLYYNLIGPILIIHCVIFHFTYHGKKLAIYCYYGLSLISFAIAFLYGLQMINKLIHPTTLLTGNFLLSGCYILKAMTHLATSFIIYRHQAKIKNN